MASIYGSLPPPSSEKRKELPDLTAEDDRDTKRVRKETSLTADVAEDPFGFDKVVADEEEKAKASEEPPVSKPKADPESQLKVALSKLKLFAVITFDFFFSKV